jgi:hypothetical protein
MLASTPDKQGGANQTLTRIVWMDPAAPSWLGKKFSTV